MDFVWKYLKRRANPAPSAPFDPANKGGADADGIVRCMHGWALPRRTSRTTMNPDR